VDHPFECPSCKSKTGLLRSSREVKTYNDLIGSACVNCGHVISDDDIKRAALALADSLVKNFKFKR